MNIDRTDTFLDRADRAAQSSVGDRKQSETSFLQRLLVDIGAGVATVVRSPVELFRAALRDGATLQQLGGALQVLGIPLQQLAGGPRAGDWLLRAMPGSGDVGHLSVLASDPLMAPATLASDGIECEATRPGYYAFVIEAGAHPHIRSARFARRVLDARGRVPPHTLILRPTSLETGFDEGAPIEGGPTSKRTSITRDIPIEFFRLKFDEFINQRKDPLVTIRIHDNKLKVTFAKDLENAHKIKPYERNLGHLEAKRWPHPDYVIKDLNSNRVTADAEIVAEKSTRSGKTMGLKLSLGFETKGIEFEVNNFGDVDLKLLTVHVHFALIRGVSDGRGVIDFRPSVTVDVKASVNNWWDSTGRDAVRSGIVDQVGKALQDPDLHKKFSLALTRWLVGGEDWEVQRIDVAGTQLQITYLEPPRDEFMQVYPETPQKRLTVGSLSKIDHIVVLMMENRSFDHMLGYLKLTGAMPKVDGLTGKETNVYQTKTFRPFHLTSTVFPHDPCHGRDCAQTQIDKGTMAGFVRNFAEHVKSPQINPGDVMGYYDGKDLPVYDVLAREFAVCNRWFCAHPGPTWPNRFFTLTGRLGVSWYGNPEYRNPDIVTFAPSQTKTIFDHLSDRQVTWRYYEHGYCFLRLFHRWVYDVQQIRPGKEFFDAARAGKLPSVCYIDPDFIEIGPVANDDHAPADVRDGQRLIGRIVEALMEGKAWKNTLLIVTYDEHGGFYDHVAPPPAVSVSNVKDYGVRVPTFVISPLVERGTVSNTVFDHTSILKTIVRRFCAANPPDLGERVAAANDVGSLLTRARARTDKPKFKLPSPSPTAPKESIEAAPLTLTSLRSFHKLLAVTRERYARGPQPAPSQTPTQTRPTRAEGART